MQLAHAQLRKVQGCNFYKLMGSGAKEGFSIWPNLKVFCLLMNWQTEESKRKFYKESEFWSEYKGNATEHLHVEMEATKAMGTWDEVQPFAFKPAKEHSGPIGVLTRATIKKRYIPFFWSQVPKASRKVADKEGHLFSIGVGEVPLLHQATLSIWESKEAMHRYAYQDKAHVEMIQKTRKLGWYSEELFAEFRLILAEGRWKGRKWNIR